MDISDNMSLPLINEPSENLPAILGSQAWEGVIHNSNTFRVSKTDNLYHHIQADLELATELGLLELVGSDSLFEQTYKFTAKSFQEHCAGHFLASLADKSIKELNSYIINLDLQCILSLQRVFLVASYASKAACQVILSRIVDIYQTEGDTNIATKQHATNGSDDLICLALQCNMECDSQGRFNSVLEKLLPKRCISFRGIPSMSPIGYYFKYLAANDKIESISVALDKCSTCSFNKLPIHVDTEINLLEAIEDGIYNKLSPNESPNASPNTLNFDAYEFFAALRFTQLMSLVLNNVHLHGYIHNFVKLIRDGYLSLLAQIEFCHAHLTEHDLEDMTPLGTLKRLKTLNLSRNKAGDGLPVLINALEGKSTIEEVNFSHMEASSYVTNYILQKLSTSRQLISLKLHGNGVNEASGEYLVSALSSPMWCLLNFLNISVHTLPNPTIATLTKTIGDLKHLHELHIFDSFDAEYLLRQMVDAFHGHAKLDTLLLGSHLDPRKADVNPVSSSTWTLFAETLYARSNVRSLTLVGIPLHAVDLQRSLHLFKRQRFRRFG